EGGGGAGGRGAAGLALGAGSEGVDPKQSFAAPALVAGERAVPVDDVVAPTEKAAAGRVRALPFRLGDARAACCSAPAQAVSTAAGPPGLARLAGRCRAPVRGTGVLDPVAPFTVATVGLRRAVAVAAACGSEEGHPCLVGGSAQAARGAWAVDCLGEVGCAQK
ncbi:unnamed protein product, partial [Prorocentrum cordatum]